MVCGGCQGRRHVVVFRFRSCRSSEVILPFFECRRSSNLMLFLERQRSQDVILTFEMSGVIRSYHPFWGVRGHCTYCLGLQKSSVRCVILLGASEIIKDDPSVLGHQRPLDVVLTVWSVRGHRSDMYFFWGCPRLSEAILLFLGVRSHQR